MRPSSIAFAILASLSLSASAQIVLKPGDNVGAIVSAAPAGSSFVFQAGTFRRPSITPKSGDTFSGPSSGKAVLDGAQPITFTPLSGTSYYSYQIGAEPLDTGRCQDGHPLCHLTRDLFYDSTVLTPVSDESQLTSKTWYYDASTQSAVISFNPGSHMMEIGTAICAFCGYQSNVTIKGVLSNGTSNLVVERYAVPSTTGAVGFAAAGANWTVEGIEARYNHGGGVQVGNGGLVQNCYLHHNGQKGLGAHGSNVTIQNNEFGWNGYAWFEYSWESGGAKFGGLDSAEILNNYSHDNNGAGLWDDVGSIYVHYKGNKVVNNVGAGIQHELGYQSVIEDNILWRNGYPPRVSMWNGQVSVQNSTHTTVQNNTVIVAAAYGSGLVIVNQDRNLAPGLYGPYIGAYNTVINNDVTFEGTDGAGGVMGVAATGVGNVIDNNTYHIYTGEDKHHFEGFGVKSFAVMQANGWEVHSKEIFTPAP